MIRVIVHDYFYAGQQRATISKNRYFEFITKSSLNRLKLQYNTRIGRFDYLVLIIRFKG